MKRKKRKLSSTEILRLLKMNKPLLEECHVRRIGLFGSFSRNQQSKNSDIDFLVEFKQPDFDDFMDLAFALEDLMGRKVDLITKSGLSPHIKPYIEKEIKWHEI